MSYQKYINYIAGIRTSTDPNRNIIHHIKPRAFQGTDDPDNLVLVTAWEHVCAHRLIVLSLPIGSKARQQMIFALKNCFSSLMKELYKKDIY